MDKPGAKSREIRAIVPNSQLPLSAASVRKWAHELQEHWDLYDLPSSYFATRAGISQSVWSRIWTGAYDQKRVPIAVARQLVQLFSEINVTLYDVLSVLGYPTFDLLAQAVTEMDDLPEKTFIVRTLAVTRTEEWQKSTSPWKTQVIERLAADGDMIDEVRNIALLIYAWRIDPHRDTPRDDPEVLNKL